MCQAFLPFCPLPSSVKIAVVGVCTRWEPCVSALLVHKLRYHRHTLQGYIWGWRMSSAQIRGTPMEWMGRLWVWVGSKACDCCRVTHLTCSQLHGRPVCSQGLPPRRAPDLAFLKVFFTAVMSCCSACDANYTPEWCPCPLLTSRDMRTHIKCQLESYSLALLSSVLHKT